ncbi:MAG: hypothetical protein FRX49_06594 [Trebouxia sp. A1-2]|nr:MAG: hypothetical protein FRX49_06594 [Trebouxia sp. A1-2]
MLCQPRSFTLEGHSIHCKTVPEIIQAPAVILQLCVSQYGMQQRSIPLITKLEALQLLQQDNVGGNGAFQLCRNTRLYDPGRVKQDAGHMPVGTGEASPAAGWLHFWSARFKATWVNVEQPAIGNLLGL